MGRNVPNTGSMAAYIIFQVRMVHYLQLSSVLELWPPTTPSESTSSQSLQRKLMSRTQVCQVQFGQLPSLIFFFNLKFLPFNIPIPPHPSSSSFLLPTFACFWHLQSNCRPALGLLLPFLSSAPHDQCWLHSLHLCSAFIVLTATST